jgi:Flp pilus assembly protein CpaB
VPFVRKLSRRSKALVVLAAACGFLTFRIVSGYASELDALRPIAGTPAPVVVASHPLTRGAVLTEADLRLERVPAAYAPPGAVATIDHATGRTLVSDLAEGEAVTATRVALAGGPVASVVPSGLRAFVVRAAVPAGIVSAGDRVDVLATYGGPHPYSETVATELEVLSTADDAGATIAAGGDASRSLVLLVTPDTAERLAYATAYADLSVSVAPAPLPTGSASPPAGPA